nr:NAD(P)-binding domain-containing protein [Bacillus sp. JCM 19034]
MVARIKKTRADKERTPVTVIGLGPMGRALARAFLKNDHPTTVWNRSPGKADDLVDRGAVLANTAVNAIEASPLVIICVLDYNAVHSIVNRSESILKGKALVNLTSDSPKQARQMSLWATEHGVNYLDGTIMTPTPTIGHSTASILYSGTKDVYQAYQSTLASLGGTASYLGPDPGRAAAYDIALLDFFWTSMNGYVHALALASTENISSQELLPYTKGIIGIMPNIMDVMAQEVDQQEYPGDGSNIASNAAGMEHIIQVAEEHRIDASMLRAAKAIAQRAIDKGYGNDGFSRLSDVLKEFSNDND